MEYIGTSTKIPAYRQAGKHQTPNKFKIFSPHPSPLPTGEREGVRGLFEIEIGIYLGFVIWDLEFKTIEYLPINHHHHGS
jgi:hypothetical protein